MKIKIILILIIFLSCFIFSWSEEKDTKVHIIEKYFYEGLSLRDPFLPLSGDRIAKAKLGLTKDAVPPSLGSLQLKGFIIDKSDKIALFTSPYGSYVLVNGKLYDRQNRQVRGFTGKIILDKENKPKGVVIVAENGDFKEFDFSATTQEN